ncbi:hypothetical protein X747_24785 [Mesorhizobium sp. LNJC384A00]|uniref:hypothetical protein n=1 Tax=Mesorhizobium sp. LNJC384A00 TaxID=1287268 RepID=UPI0003CF3626|nr:hypothetical protein [Mesorhizobium sp. LNJC384A00]ESY37885.1 hypothetical protein X747_24785 [Mesorhizobium sp. LNJC384A00]
MAHDLGFPVIADGQAADQWQTSNDADAGLGNAFGDTYAVDFSAGNVTLNSTQYRSAMIFKPSAALAAARTLILPAVKRPFEFHNSDATYAVTLKKTNGASPETATTIAVAAGEIFIGYTDGTSTGLFGAVVSTTSSGVSDGDKGDITVSSSGTVWAVDNDVVTNAKAANMAQSTIKGRAVSAGTGDPTDLTATQATAILDAMVGDSGSGGTKGLAPAPASGDAAAAKFLKADGTWAVPAGSGGVSDGDKATSRFPALAPFGPLTQWPARALAISSITTTTRLQDGKGLPLERQDIS